MKERLVGVSKTTIGVKRLYLGIAISVVALLVVKGISGHEIENLSNRGERRTVVSGPIGGEGRVGLDAGQWDPAIPGYQCQ